MVQSRSGSFVLCYRSLASSGRGYTFPCDHHGRVDLDQLSDRARINYLYARAMVGRELGQPAVRAADPAPEDSESGRPARADPHWHADEDGTHLPRQR